MRMPDMSAAIVVIALQVLVSTALGAAEWRVTMGSLWGQAGDEAFRACVVDDEGVAIVGGNGLVQVGGIPVHDLGGTGGVIVRIDTLLGELLSISTLPGPVSSLARDEEGNVFALAGGLFKLTDACDKVVWKAGGGGKRVCIDGDGGAWVHGGGSAVHYDATGKQIGSLSVKGKDFAVDYKNKRVFTCGWNAGRSKKSGNPVHVPWVHGFDYQGKKLWTMWGHTPTEVDTVSDMADSHPQKLFFGPDGYLYMFGDSDGGNTCYRHDPLKLGGSPGNTLGGTPFNEMWKAFRSVRMLFVCRIDTSNGSIVRGSFFYGKFINPEANNREEIGDAQALGLFADKKGRVYLSGVMRCNPPWTTNAVHKEAAKADRKGYWKNLVATDEGYLAIFEDDFRRLSFCSGFNQGTSGAYSSQMLCGAGYGDGAVVVGFMKKPETDAEPASATAFLRGSVQDGYGGGKDAYVATLSAKRPPTDPIAYVRLLMQRLYGDLTDPLAAEVAAASSYGELIPKLAAAEDVRVRDLASLLTRVGEQTLDRAASYKMDDPALTQELYTDATRIWAGTAIATKADEALDALKKDKAFKAELTIGKAKLAFMDLLPDLQDAEKAEATSFLDKEYNKKNGRVMRKMQSSAQAMLKKWPEHRFTRDVLSVCSTYAIPVTKQDEELLKQLAVVFQARRSMLPRRGKVDTSTEAFKKRYKKQLDQMQRTVKAMKKTAGKHPYTDKAIAVASEFQLKI